MVEHGAIGSVAQLSSVHPWDDNRIFGRHSAALAANGFRVVLIANSGPIAPRDTTDRGVRIVARKRPRSRWRRILMHVPTLYNMARRVRADVYHLHDPELAVLIPLFRCAGAKVIYDAHEDLPSQIFDKDYLPRIVRPLLSRLARGLCLYIDLFAHEVVAATPKIAERFNPAHCTVVHNYPELLDDVDAQTTPYPEREPVIAFVGGMSRVRGLTQMVDAVGRTDLAPDWTLRLVGPMSPDIEVGTLTSRPGWERVDFRGQVGRRDARRLIAGARIGLVLFQWTCAHVDALPTKLFEYMASGVPVVVSDFPLWRDIVARYECGLVADPADPLAIAEKIEYLATHPVEAEEMGRRGRAAVVDALSWSSEQQRLLEVYTRLAAGFATAARTPRRPA